MKSKIKVLVLVHLGSLVLGLASCATPATTPNNNTALAETPVQGEVASRTTSSTQAKGTSDLDAAKAPVVEHTKPLLIVTNPTATGVTLFADELAPLRGALAEALAKTYDVVPLETVNQDVKNARNNTLPNGKQCARIPHPILISHALHEHSSLTDSVVMCGEAGCELRIQSQDNRVRMHTKLSAPAPNDSPEATVDRWVQELKDRPLEQTRRVEAPLNKPLVASVKRSKKPRVVGLVDPSVLWTKDLGKPLQASLKAIQRCKSKHPTINPKDRYMMSINAGGKVDRCETENADHHRSDGFDCVCDALKKNVRFPKAKKGERRAAMSVFVDSGKEQLPWVSLEFQSSDDKVAHLATDIIPNEALAECMAPLGTDFEVGVTMEVAGQGEHIAHSTSWTTVGKRNVPDSVKTCLKPILRSAHMTCPWNERATVRGKVFVTFDPVE